MKTYVDDPFDAALNLRGLALQLSYMYFQFYEYAFNFTFKRALKEYASEYKDPFDDSIEEMIFFDDISDSMVQRCCRVQDKIITMRHELLLIQGINQFQDVTDEIVIRESNRFSPYFLISKRAKSYRKLTFYFERFLEEVIASLYSYACVITASKYRIPQVLKKQFLQQIPEALYLLNSDDHTVVRLKELICTLQEELEEFRLVDRYKKKPVDKKTKKVVKELQRNLG